MSGWLKKIRDRISPSHADSHTNADDRNVTEERAPGGDATVDAASADLNTQAGGAVRGTLGWKKPDA